MAWCVLGDFNVGILVKGRVWVLKENRAEMDGFNSFIDRCQLYDIPTVGRVYTWYRPNDTSRSRLNRTLVSENWFLKWSGST